jgi:hypothetical protein
MVAANIIFIAHRKIGLNFFLVTCSNPLFSLANVCMFPADPIDDVRAFKSLWFKQYIADQYSWEDLIDSGL